MTDLVSLLVAGRPGDEEAVRRTVASALRQDSRRWELVVAMPRVPVDDLAAARSGQRPAGRTDERGADARVRHVAVDVPVDLPTTDLTAHLLEAARRVARGTVLGVLGPGDELEPGALAAVAVLLEAEDRPDVLYTDEQWPGEGAAGIATKPDFLPHHHRSYPYLGRLCLVRTALAAQVGGFRPGMTGVEEWDLQLRVTEAADRVVHLPVVAVSRPVPPPADEATRASALRAVGDVVARSGRAGTVEPAEVAPGVRVWWAVDDPPLVSVIIPTAGGRRTIRGEDGVVLERALRSLVERTTYERWEVVLVTSEHTPPEVVDDARQLLGDRLVHAPVPGAFNFSTSVNEGARLASGELLLLLNDDTEALEPRWLERMVSVAQEPTVGVVGAKLLFEDRTIQHVGVIFTDSGTPAHNLIFEADAPDTFGRKVLDTDYSAVTGACLLTRASLFAQVGGFSPDLPLNFNDVDYCLKVRARGLDVVCTPFAVLHHYESSTRSAHIEQSESDHLERRWGLRRMLDPHPQYRTGV
ncbi:glycosyltransferase [Actinotalea ferrariae]|uniref:glycosyltransferase family 2 protein n=1 Tax=Actinotalea ferrariae TaxID=1386098 RepID=UPI001C8BBEE3|nr:glycosyltransferase [Actinotalea ferrariae]MBX9246683.1 glycosyltransferase [Actinotalea ferrariae]